MLEYIQKKITVKSEPGEMKSDGEDKAVRRQYSDNNQEKERRDSNEEIDKIDYWFRYGCRRCSDFMHISSILR